MAVGENHDLAWTREPTARKRRANRAKLACPPTAPQTAPRMLGELFNPLSNTTKEIPLSKADVALVQNDGVVLVGGLRFRNNGQRGVEML